MGHPGEEARGALAGGGLLGRCLEGLLEGCEAALSVLEDAREAVGKHRGKGGGMARLLRRAAQLLADGARPCIEACGAPGAPGAGGVGDALRCGLGDAVDELQRSLHGVALRLERLPRLSGETEEELAAALLDTAAAAVGSLCAAARRGLWLLPGDEPG